MLEYIRDLLNVDSLSPHGICLLWRPELIWTHAISDAVIGVAYFSIPVFLAYLISKRPDVSFNWVIWAFAIFILACGTTHFLSIWTLWVPDYGLEAVVKAITAFASVLTAILLWPLLPKALAWPSPQQLSFANDALRRRVAERDQALQALEKESAERERSEAMLRQSQKMEAIGQLTGGIAHDYNNLLTAVLMSLDRARGNAACAGDPKLARALGNATAAAEKAAVLSQRMLAFARKEPVRSSVLDANRVIAELEPLMRNALSPGMELSVDLTVSLPHVRADQNQLENALLNLVLNARDAMPDGGQVICRTKHGSRDEAGAVIEVVDTGAGMSADIVSRAFEPFFTTKPVDRGTGLGLSQVYGFAQQSHGHVVIHSEVGKGTRVELFLPSAVAA